jgi:hypothetical protein
MQNGPDRQFARALMALAALCAPLCQAHLPAAYGREFVRLQHSTLVSGTDSARKTRDATASAARDAAAGEGQRQAYLARLSSLEHQGGPFAPSIAEPLRSLAALHAARGDYERSLPLYQRALYIQRINNGLYSEQLIPLLEEQLGLLSELDDIEGQDRIHWQLFRIHGAGDPPYDARRLAAADRFLQWQREATLRTPERDASRRLLSLLQVNRRLLDTYLSSPAPELAWERRLVLSQLHNFYLLQGMEPLSVGAPGVTDGIGQAADRRQLATWQQRVIADGASLLREFLARWPALPLQQKAPVVLELADWYQWNGKWRSARELYQSLAQQLAEAGERATLERWFAEPVELPANGVFGSAPGAAASAVTLRLDVSASGDVQRLETVAEQGDAGSRLRRLVREAHFRPAFSDGKAVTASGLERRYRLLP